MESKDDEKHYSDIESDSEEYESEYYDIGCAGTTDLITSEDYTKQSQIDLGKQDNLLYIESYNGAKVCYNRNELLKWLAVRNVLPHTNIPLTQNSINLLRDNSLVGYYLMDTNDALIPGYIYREARNRSSNQLIPSIYPKIFSEYLSIEDDVISLDRALEDADPDSEIFKLNKGQIKDLLARHDRLRKEMEKLTVNYYIEQITLENEQRLLKQRRNDAVHNERGFGMCNII